MRYATTTEGAALLHRQDDNATRGYCGRTALYVVDAEAASFGLATQAMRTCKACDKRHEARKQAARSVEAGLLLTDTAPAKATAPVVVDVELPFDEIDEAEIAAAVEADLAAVHAGEVKLDDYAITLTGAELLAGDVYDDVDLHQLMYVAKVNVPDEAGHVWLVTCGLESGVVGKWRVYADQELAVFRRSLDLTHTAPPADVVEGVVVKHAGAALGSAPKHAGDADVRAALDALHPLKLALMTDEADITAPDEANASMRGLVVDPRGDGRVAVYWVEAGIYVDEQRRPHGTELRIIADKLREAGWRVEDGAVRCVFAWRPIDDAQAPEDGFAVGSFVVCADGRTRRITGTASHLGEPARIVDEDGAEWVADNCRPIKVARVRRRPAPEDVARIRAQARADRTAYEVESVARRAADVKRYGDAPREGADG